MGSVNPDEHVHFEDIDAAVADIEARIEELELVIAFASRPTSIQVSKKKEGLEEALEILTDHGLY